MPAALRLTGVTAFRQELRAWPAALVAEAGILVHDAAERAAQAIRAAYPVRTDGPHPHRPVTRTKVARPRFTVRRSKKPQTPPGALRDALRVDHVDRPLHPRSQVRNTNPLSNIFENGTQARQTSLGADRGSMPPGHVFIPMAIRARRAMDAAVVALLKREDLKVSGT